MKKFLSMILALVLVLSMATVAFADTTTTTTYEDMSTVTLTKTYTVSGATSTAVSPAETFKFGYYDENGDFQENQVKLVSAVNTGVEYNASTQAKPTISTVTFAKGAAGSSSNTGTITITLPTYNAVGVYTYSFVELDNNTTGVTYRADEIKLVVTVIEQGNKVRVAAVHTEAANGEKSNSFDNNYAAGTLAVTKTVTGNMGDQMKEFNVTVTFTAPAGTTVRETINYTDDGEAKTVAAGWTGSTTATIDVKHGETITFTNIPYGVTYTVVEGDYTADGYTATYAYSDNTKTEDGDDYGTINATTYDDTVGITNNKVGDVDTGITMDTVPYIVLLAAAFVGMIALVAKKRAREF